MHMGPDPMSWGWTIGVLIVCGVFLWWIGRRTR